MTNQWRGIERTIKDTNMTIKRFIRMKNVEWRIIKLDWTDELVRLEWRYKEI